ncbi:hypothetical protein E3T26_07160 [Cryobacterium sp. TMT1-21]|uniref:hypothetical protein n=1 Tax=unclassified Cryobacterium TaxID=2649013 RepID=UPI00106BDC5F|nr:MULTISPECIES: hypothetical protein [unclassified Cryobacterium]TFC83738.1 hypothetical protein E3T24_11215 [Cryobacterium sp. TmT2-59]TFD15351.1 hypothetical protein E3T26_07160 [Cryobacterium sp. TMT1-21]TFD20566.1 hypothetical protein E3T42_02155 [Cryobacterium sp. TMT4-10]TFD20753.1 hypothetical protein E3T32_08270 [Cryobacterium sp. TMT2-23]TFD39062.1 hypothetical protein E3T37_08665 [Cryobacterium sp. TMT2-10]
MEQTMDAREHGKRLSRIVTGTIGVLAVVAASALGLHSWADALATRATAAGPTTQQAPAADTQGSDDGEWGDGEEGSSQPVQQAPQPQQNVSPITPGNGRSPNATTNGS